MGIKVIVKLDDGKIRIYLESNEVTLDSIKNYLNRQSYKDIDQVLLNEGITQVQQPRGYQLADYSMAYKMTSGQTTATLVIEAWFKIKKHYNDDDIFAKTITALINPVLPPIVENTIPLKPNMRVKNLKSRNYVTVLEQDNTTYDNVLKLVQNLECILQELRIEANLDPKISSDVTVSFENVGRASHAKGLSVFGHMPNPSPAGCSSSSSTSYSPYTAY